jgi:hypothetical protein
VLFFFFSSSSSSSSSSQICKEELHLREQEAGLTSHKYT